MSPCLTSGLHYLRGNNRIWQKIREKLNRKKEVKEKTNLTVKQMVAGGNEVKGQVIFNNWGILK